MTHAANAVAPAAGSSEPTPAHARPAITPRAAIARPGPGLAGAGAATTDRAGGGGAGGLGGDRAPASAPDPASTEIAGAREVTAYELSAGAPLSFTLPPGASELRILTNLDLEPHAPPAGLPYAVRVRVREEGRDDTFPLMALPALDADGDRTAFFLGREQSPARTRILALTRASSLPGTLEIALEAAGTAGARRCGCWWRTGG